jgi:hypothetical protein
LATGAAHFVTEKLYTIRLIRPKIWIITSHYADEAVNAASHSVLHPSLADCSV